MQVDPDAAPVGRADGPVSLPAARYNGSRARRPPAVAPREHSVSHELRTTDPARTDAPGPVSSADDPLAPARARGERAKRELLAAQGELLNEAQVADRVGLSRKTVEVRRQRGLLLALPLGDETWAFPVWQFADDGLLPGLEDVLISLTASGPWSRVQ